jgi:hypothetical protein
VGDEGSHLGSAPGESHPEETEAEGDDRAPEEGLLELVVVSRVGDGRVLEIALPVSLIFGQAGTIGIKVVIGAVADAGAVLP